MSALKLPPKLLDLLPRRRRPEGEQDPAGEGDPTVISARKRRTVENLIYAGWGLIFVKSCVVVWAVAHYHMPFSPMWVIGPTVTFAALATAVYYYLVE